jgi:glycosyltransferase involved in cell wall biosynthesis
MPTSAVSWQEKEERILYVGRVHPEKGIELLLQAFARAKAQSLPNWKLEIVGPWETRDGGGGDRWANSLRDRQVHPDIEWSGPLFRHDELAARYRRAQVFAYPSLAERGETFGLAPLEAMAWGAVPIVSALACFKDFVAPRQNGFVFDHRAADPVASLATVLASLPQQPLEELSREALRVRETHAPKRIAARFISDFESILRQPEGN